VNIFSPADHQTTLAHTRMLIERSRKILEENLVSTFVGVKQYDPANRSTALEAEVEIASKIATGKNATADLTNNLIALTDKMLRHCGRDIEAENGIVRCFAMSEFVVATYTLQPCLALYRIMQRDNEANISQLFVGTWHWALGIPDLRLYRRGPWEKRFRKLAAKIMDLVPSQHQLH
jgi:hypothetical protein